MPKAQWWRLLIGLGGSTWLVAMAFTTTSGWTAFGLAIVGFVISGALAETVFRRLATAEEVRSDLEDRVRNPPA